MFIVQKNPKSIAAEAYRSLKTNIQYSSFDKEYKTIVITSSNPGEGKSTTSGNLALTLAEGESRVITAGKVPPNPAEMLGSKAMSAFLEEMKEHFDYIILDTPPVQAVADAQILSTKVDGTIIVVRAGVTKKEDIHDTVNTLKKVNANIIGTVLHAVDSSKNKYYYYYGEE